MAPLNLPLGPTSISVKVQPVVLFNICDSYIRRNEGTDRVIGTLLGSVEAGVVEIKNSYAVPHNESSDQVAVDILHHKTLYDLHRKVNPKEYIVGWYSTGLGVSGSDALIQDFYAQECTNPVHLTVDTGLTGATMAIKAYVSRVLSLGDRMLATEFQEVACEVKTVEVERIGVELLENQVTEKLPTDLEGLNVSISRLEDSITKAQTYVQDVLEGRRQGDRGIGRYLSDTIDAIPKVTKEDLEALYHDNVQDVLLVMYLANLVRSHVALADKLGTAVLPLM